MIDYKMVDQRIENMQGCGEALFKVIKKEYKQRDVPYRRIEAVRQAVKNLRDAFAAELAAKMVKEAKTQSSPTEPDKAAVQ